MPLKLPKPPTSLHRASNKLCGMLTDQPSGIHPILKPMGFRNRRRKSKCFEKPGLKMRDMLGNANAPLPRDFAFNITQENQPQTQTAMRRIRFIVRRQRVMIAPTGDEFFGSGHVWSDDQSPVPVRDSQPVCAVLRSHADAIGPHYSHSLGQSYR